MSSLFSEFAQPVARIGGESLRIEIFRISPKEEGDRAHFSGELCRVYQDSAGYLPDSIALSGDDYLRVAQLMLEAYATERKLYNAEWVP